MHVIKVLANIRNLHFEAWVTIGYNEAHLIFTASR